jgi:hypothetical protein
MQHISGTPVQPCEVNPGIPEELGRIAMRAMCSDIDERYQSATELLDDLENFRKQQAALLAKSRQAADAQTFETGITPDVQPIISDWEKSKVEVTAP